MVHVLFNATGAVSGRVYQSVTSGRGWVAMDGKNMHREHTDRHTLSRQCESGLLLALVECDFVPVRFAHRHHAADRQVIMLLVMASVMSRARNRLRTLPKLLGKISAPLNSSLPHHLARGLVVAQAAEGRLAQHAVVRPFGETHLRDELRLDPGAMREFRLGEGGAPSAPLCRELGKGTFGPPP